MKNVYLVSFDTDAPISVDDRHGLKEIAGEMVRACLGNYDLQVAVDNLEPSEPHVAALLPPAV